MDVYAENILDHYRQPRNAGRLEAPTHEHKEHNPSCGDIIEMPLGMIETDIVTKLLDFIPDANRAAVAKYKDKIGSKALALIVADTLPVQIDQMKEGLSLGQVGQRPFEMGYKTMNALNDMKNGKPALQGTCPKCGGKVFKIGDAFAL